MLDRRDKASQAEKRCLSKNKVENFNCTSFKLIEHISSFSLRSYDLQRVNMNLQ